MINTSLKVSRAVPRSVTFCCVLLCFASFRAVAGMDSCDGRIANAIIFMEQLGFNYSTNNLSSGSVGFNAISAPLGRGIIPDGGTVHGSGQVTVDTRINRVVAVLGSPAVNTVTKIVLVPARAGELFPANSPAGEGCVMWTPTSGRCVADSFFRAVAGVTQTDYTLVAYAKEESGPKTYCHDFSIKMDTAFPGVFELR